MSRETDTIAAIATAPGRGGIGVVRVSGPGAAAVLRAVLRPCPASLETHRVYHGHACEPASGAALDEVLAFLMRGPRSYTGEDVVELQGHGGGANLARLLAAVCASGARLAEPGEFTRRAFLRGRIDLTQAEAVADVVAARSARALRQAQAQLRGALGVRVGALRGGLVEVLAEVEAGLDFPEEDLPPAPRERIAAAAAAVASEARVLAATFAQGRALSEGLAVALVGRPNAGKSSLLNALAEEERALTDPAPGTTRDFVEVELEWDGVPVTLVDTAGLAPAAANEVEARGIRLGRQRVARADVAVLLVEAGTPLEGAAALWAELPAGCGRQLVLTKADLLDGPVPPAPSWASSLVATSAVRGEGLGELRRAILRAGGAAEGGADAEEPVRVSSARHRDALLAAGAAAEAAAAAAPRAPADLVAVDLHAAVEALGRVTGEGVGEDVLDAIFGRFCIGK